MAQIARVEVPAAVWRKHRIGELSSSSAAVLIADFEADWFGTDDRPRRFEPVRMTALVLEDAARLTGVHGLRADDAVQLATARGTGRGPRHHRVPRVRPRTARCGVRGGLHTAALLAELHSPRFGGTRVNVLPCE